jgi:hypothetical protein
LQNIFYILINCVHKHIIICKHINFLITYEISRQALFITQLLKYMKTKQPVNTKEHGFKINCICHSVWKSFIIMKSFLSTSPVWWPGLKNSPTVTHACHKRRLKWAPSAWGYSWATLSPGAINTEAWSSRLGLGAELTIQPCKKLLL